MPKITFSIAFPIILVGLFVLVMVFALNYQTPNLVLYITFSLLVVCIFLFGVAIGQNFASSIKKLLARAEGLVKGDVESRLYLTTKNELGELATALNAIAQELEARKEEAKVLETSVDIKVKARTEPLRETIIALDQKIKNRTLELERTTRDFAALRAQLSVKEAELQDIKSKLTTTTTRKKNARIT